MTALATATQPVVSVRNLYTHFKTAEGVARAVDGVSFDIKEGETFAIVGESGCGKSVTAYSIMQLVQKPAGFHPHGEIILNSENIKNFDILKMSESEKRKMRGGEVAMIFQEPMTSLNPVFTIGHQIAEAAVLHQEVTWQEGAEIAQEMLHKVGIPDPSQRVKEYPHQLSGGMKQRAMIAMALSCKPSLLVADEPTTALDVTIQAQILSLMKELQEEMGMSILLITHDLGVVCEMADRVAVMYAGKIVEKASKEKLFSNPQHPYSLKLFQSLPDIDKRGQNLRVIKGFVPNATKFPDHCRFADRCDFSFQPCRDETKEPRLLNHGDDEGEHLVACHGYDEAIPERPKIELTEEEGTFDKPTFEESPVILNVRNLKQYFPIKARKGVLPKRIKLFLTLLNSVAMLSGLISLFSGGIFTGLVLIAASGLSFSDVFMKTRRGGMNSIISYTTYMIFGAFFMVNSGGIIMFPFLFLWFIMLLYLLMPGKMWLRAVDNVDLTIRKGHTMALVGESGCGKTTIGKTIIQLNKPTDGSVRYGGKELTNLDAEGLKPFRQRMQIIFQDPYGSLNPRQMIGEIIEEGMLVHGVGKTKEEREAIIRDVLRHVNMAPEMMTRYPHEFSGGQRQRIGIARVLAIQPDFVVCDEPTSALDVSVQAQILNLLNQLQDQFELTYLFITHDLRVVEFIADHVSVMYLGRIVEEGKTDEIFTNPKHPYTRALLTAIPETDPKSGFKKIKLEGDVPSPINPPRGCHFNPRCQHAMPICKAAYPGTTEESVTHKVRCFLYGTGNIDVPEEVKWDGRKALKDWNEERAQVRESKELAEVERRSKLVSKKESEKPEKKEEPEKTEEKSEPKVEEKKEEPKVVEDKKPEKKEEKKEEVKKEEPKKEEKKPEQKKPQSKQSGKQSSAKKGGGNKKKGKGKKKKK